MILDLLKFCYDFFRGWWPLTVILVCVLMIVAIVIAVDRPIDAEKWETKAYVGYYFKKGGYESAQNFMGRVLDFAAQQSAYTITYHKTPIGIKTLKGYVVVKEKPEVSFFGDREAIVWWWKDKTLFPEKIKEVEKKK